MIQRDDVDTEYRTLRMAELYAAVESQVREYFLSKQVLSVEAVILKWKRSEQAEQFIYTLVDPGYLTWATMPLCDLYTYMIELAWENITHFVVAEGCDRNIIDIPFSDCSKYHDWLTYPEY